MIRSDITTLFTIMPTGHIRDHNKRVALLKSIAKSHRIKVRIPKYDRANPRFNLSKTLAALTASDLVLVDLTHERPSCYYELGLAEALGCPILIVARERTPIHQTSRRSEVQFYRTMRDFEALIAERIRRGRQVDVRE
jgi:nucleoside 2-deoxyribosyltransferase